MGILRKFGTKKDKFGPVKKSGSDGRPSNPDLSQKDKKGLVKSGLAKSGPLEKIPKKEKKLEKLNYGSHPLSTSFCPFLYQVFLCRISWLIQEEK